MDYNPLRDLERWNMAHFVGGGSGGSETNTQANMRPWHRYVPPETYAAYKDILPKVQERYDKGLRPDERAQYTDEILTHATNQFSGAEKSLQERLGRSGISGGAAAESMSDLARSKAGAVAKGLSGLTRMDMETTDKNLDMIRKFIALPSAPVQVGSSTTTTPAGGGS